jgi:hypothetical protein
MNFLKIFKIEYKYITYKISHTLRMSDQKTENLVETSLNETGQLITTIEDISYLYPIDYNKGGAITDIMKAAEESLKSYKLYENIPKEFKFRRLPVYGSVENPLFLSSCVFKYLFPTGKDQSKFIKKFGETENIWGNYLVKSPAMVSKSNGTSQSYPNVNLLNELGLMKAMCSITTPFAIAFQNIMLGFIKNVRQNHNDVFVKVLKEETEKYKKQLELEGARADEAEKSVCYNRDMSIAVEKVMDFVNDDVDIESQGSPNSQELIILRHKYMKFISLYIVNEDYVNQLKKSKSKLKKEKKPRKPRKKKMLTYEMSSDSEPESESDEKLTENEFVNVNKTFKDKYDNDNLYELPYTCFNFTSLKSDEYCQDTLYFAFNTFSGKTIKNIKKYHKVADISIYDVKHYNHMMNLLSSSIEVPSQKIYKCSYSDITDARHKSLVEKCVGPLFEEVRSFRKYREF